MPESAQDIFLQIFKCLYSSDCEFKGKIISSKATVYIGIIERVNRIAD